jgi:hypothetical protein
MGVDKPCHIIRQGVELDLLDADAIATVRRAHRRPGDIVLGFVAAWLLSSSGQGGDNPLSNLDHLLDLWSAISARLRVRGSGSSSRRARPFRLVPRAREHRALRTRDREPGAAACRELRPGALRENRGPRCPEHQDRRVHGRGRAHGRVRLRGHPPRRRDRCGHPRTEPGGFRDRGGRIGTNGDRRRSLADAACEAGRQIDAAELARRYEAEILDVYLP